MSAVVPMDLVIVAGLAAALVGIAAVVVIRLRRRSEARREQRRPAPWSRSEKLSLAGIAVGAAIGLAGFVFSGNGGSPTPTDVRAANPFALAALIRQGPFTQKLPAPLAANGLADVGISDPSAANRVDAVQLKIRFRAGGLVSGAFAHMEIYRSESAAFVRAQARIREIKEFQGPEVIRGTSESYCAYINNDAAWECGGSRGLVYAEATVSPSPNALRPLAAGTSSALLDYAEEKARVGGT